MFVLWCFIFLFSFLVPTEVGLRLADCGGRLRGGRQVDCPPSDRQGYAGMTPFREERFKEIHWGEKMVREIMAVLGVGAVSTNYPGG